jgi:hypothetical protein
MDLSGDDESFERLIGFGTGADRVDSKLARPHLDRDVLSPDSSDP